ncbi:MAG: hypothetical protein VBE63_25450, partial [Lamprobacter sp.]|nr:hypothetical protein [Lamprobacter sp.]
AKPHPSNPLVNKRWRSGKSANPDRRPGGQTRRPQDPQERADAASLSHDSRNTNGTYAMSIDELLPSVGALSHADKLRLAQIVLQQLAQEEHVFSQSEPSHVSGHHPLKGSVTFEKDIVSPIDVDWDASQ